MSTGTDQQAKVSRFFSKFAVTWDALYGGRRSLLWRLIDHTFRRDIYERYEITFDRLGRNVAGRSVLDVGCGSGIYCLEAARRGAARVVGIDAAENMIALARTRAAALGYAGVCEFARASFPPDEPVPVLQRPFDFAIVMGVMDYVPDAVTFLKALRPLVTGFAVLSFPGRHWLREPLRRYRYKLLGRCAVYGYDEEAVRGACAPAGFPRVEIARLDHSGICYIVTAHV